MNDEFRWVNDELLAVLIQFSSFNIHLGLEGILRFAYCFDINL